MEYRVELEVYNGPLDLLLYLIRRDELDIYDIPISRITDSYLGYMHMLRDMKDREGLDINVAGEFLVMAATLMEIKSATLLPKAQPTEQKDGQKSAAQELTDPRMELVQQLLEYKRLKDSATLWNVASTNTRPASPASRQSRSAPWMTAASGFGRSADLGSAVRVRSVDERSRRPQTQVSRGALR